MSGHSSWLRSRLAYIDETIKDVNTQTFARHRLFLALIANNLNNGNDDLFQNKQQFDYAYALPNINGGAIEDLPIKNKYPTFLRVSSITVGKTFNTSYYDRITYYTSLGGGARLPIIMGISKDNRNVWRVLFSRDDIGSNTKPKKDAAPTLDSAISLLPYWSPFTKTSPQVIKLLLQNDAQRLNSVLGEDNSLWASQIKAEKLMLVGGDINRDLAIILAGIAGTRVQDLDEDRIDEVIAEAFQNGTISNQEAVNLHTSSLQLSQQSHQQAELANQLIKELINNDETDTVKTLLEKRLQDLTSKVNKTKTAYDKAVKEVEYLSNELDQSETNNAILLERTRTATSRSEFLERELESTRARLAQTKKELQDEESKRTAIAARTRSLLDAIEKLPFRDAQNDLLALQAADLETFADAEERLAQINLYILDLLGRQIDAGPDATSALVSEVQRITKAKTRVEEELAAAKKQSTKQVDALKEKIRLDAVAYDQKIGQQIELHEKEIETLKRLLAQALGDQGLEDALRAEERDQVVRVVYMLENRIVHSAAEIFALRSPQVNKRRAFSDELVERDEGGFGWMTPELLQNQGLSAPFANFLIKLVT